MQARVAAWAGRLACLCVVAAALPSTANGQTDDAAVANLVQSAEFLAKDGDLDAAIRLFERAYGLRPEPVLLYNIARLHDLKGELAKARDLYQKYIDLERDPTGAARGKARLLAVLERFPGRLIVVADPAAATILVDGKPAATPSVELLYGRHDLVVRAGGYVEDRRVVEIAAGQERRVEVSLQPASGPAWCARGWTARRQGRNEDALAAFVRATEIEPLMGEAWAGRALCNAAMRKSAEAIAAFRRALAAGWKSSRELPEDAGVWHLFGQAAGAEGRVPDEVAAFGKAVALQPGSGVFLDALAMARFRQGDRTDPVALLLKAVAAKPEDAGLWHHLGYVQLFAGDIRPAIESLRHAVQIAPGHLGAWGDLVVSLIKAGELDEAEAALGRLRALDAEAARKLVPYLEAAQKKSRGSTPGEKKSR